MNDAKIKNTGYYNEHGYRQAVLLLEGDLVKVEKTLDGFFLCRSVCRNSNREVIAEVEAENLEVTGGKV